jgi:hypothetical protein
MIYTVHEEESYLYESLKVKLSLSLYMCACVCGFI